MSPCMGAAGCGALSFTGARHPTLKSEIQVTIAKRVINVKFKVEVAFMVGLGFKLHWRRA
ncbi:MAG TPA: hypothetical protein VK629_21005 [Steroidobacteraceae bacterium]|nr:hypothetical protein [Steroidobacteraceae bacterium]